MGSSLNQGEFSAPLTINQRASQQTSALHTSGVSSKSSDQEVISILAASETIDVSSSIMTKSIPSSLIHERKILNGPQLVIDVI